MDFKLVILLSKIIKKARETLTDVLYISYDGMTDPLGTSQVLPYLFELSKRNFRIHLISFEKPERYKNTGDKLMQLINENGIIWYPWSYRKSPPVLSTLLDLRDMVRTGEEICRNNTIKVIHCRSYISAIAGETLKKEFNIPMIFDMRGFWADERVEGNIWNLKNPLYKLIYSYFKKKESSLLRSSEAIISLTHKAKDILHGMYGSSVSEKITVIPCCTDLKHFSKESVSETLKSRFMLELGIEANDKVVTYIGSLGTWYMSHEMVDFFAAAHRKNVFTKFLVISKDDPSGLIQYGNSLGLPEGSIITRPAERNELPALADIGDWSLFFIRPSFSKSASSPTKMGELLALGKGLIANKGIGDNDLLFEKYSYGVLVDEFSESAYQRCLDKLPGIDVKGTRKTAEAYFALEEGAARYEQVYRSLL